ncbi:galactosyldiacylglycerol synthase [Caldicoprobacter algeriensis]|uniref:MGDG synthase family glycosyltransferase n=1 Tax=Caldicoprobacter algeriensis TaxID=699281 RepID=UPI00207ADD24|nr:galactosyldiacylglycerol synthase [Caldicoprobacter algeriensis]
MRALFLSVSAGHGHNQTAKAAMESLKAKGVDCVLLDIFEYINPILSESVAKAYLISTKFTPAVYGRLYRLGERLEKSNEKLYIGKIISSLLSRKLTVFLGEYQPDVIVCTHIFPAQVISYLREKGLSCKSVGIITDFTVHPFWEDTNLDYYVTASSLLNLQIQRKGIPLEKVWPIGIPIFIKFANKMDKAEARKLLGIENKRTILVMSGSMGYGNVDDVIRRLDKMDMDFQIISVCGNNASLKKKIDLMDIKKKIYNYGFVDNVDVMMDASDCILTKPGGLTVSESLAKCIPMILINPIPGQEDRNAEFLLNNGLAIKTSETFTVDEAVYHLFHNESRRKYMIEMMREVGRPYAADELADLLIQQIKEGT